MWLDFALTCAVILGITLLAQQSDVLAAAFATAPISSTIAICMWYYRPPPSSSAADTTTLVKRSQDELGEFAFKIVKGVTASLVFAGVVWVCAARYRWSLVPSLVAGYSCWTVAWLALTNRLSMGMV